MQYLVNTLWNSNAYTELANKDPLHNVTLSRICLMPAKVMVQVYFAISDDNERLARCS